MKKGVSKYYPFEIAKNLIRDECIESAKKYEKWFNHNIPSKIPKRPDQIYKRHGWCGWNDFLGNNNKFGQNKKYYLPFNDAKRFARTLKFTTRDQWLEYARAGKQPSNIPKRPDYYYSEWFTWKDFLVGNIKELISNTISLLPVLYVIKINNTPINVVKIDVTNGGKSALIEAQKKGARIIAAYEYTKDLDWRSLLRKYANNYLYGEHDDYIFNVNISAFLFELDNYLTKIKF